MENLDLTEFQSKIYFGRIIKIQESIERVLISDSRLQNDERFRRENDSIKEAKNNLNKCETILIELLNIKIGINHIKILRIQKAIDDIEKVLNKIEENIDLEILFYNSLLKNSDRIKDYFLDVLSYSNHLGINKNERAKINELENEIKEKEEKEIELQEKIKLLGENEDSQKKELENEINELNKEKFKDKELIEKFKNELVNYQKETNKIEKAIKKLDVPSGVLKNMRGTYEEEKNQFNFYAKTSFIISSLIFIFYFLFLSYLGIRYFGEYYSIDNTIKDLNITLYLFAMFPVVFTTTVGFLFVRQANIKSKEVSEINKRFILIHEVNQSLSALVEVNRGKDMDGKTEQVIDKLINNILEYASSNINTRKTNQNDIDINSKFDEIMNSIEKKLIVAKAIQN